MIASDVVRQSKRFAPTLNVTARVAADAAITLSGTQTIDGVACVAGDIVLVTAQASAPANGLYKVASGTWKRTGDRLLGGMLVTVTEGNNYKASVWELAVTGKIIVGTTSLSFVQIKGASNRWTPITGFTATPPSNATITVPTANVANVKVGVPIRLKISGVYKYYQCSGTGTNTLSVYGHDLTGLTIQSIDYGTPEMISLIQLVFPGLFAASTGVIMNSIAQSSCIWYGATAHIVFYKCSVFSGGGGSSGHVTKAGLNVSTTVACNGGFANVIITDSTAVVANGDAIDFYIDISSSSDQTLTLFLVLVLE